MTPSTTIELADEEATMRLGGALGAALAPGDVVALVGPLGAGKTRLVQAAAEALGVEDDVTSPTFVLVHEYRGRLSVVHIDAYRLRDEDEFEALGVEEYFESMRVIFIEWADRVARSLPAERLEIRMEPHGVDSRKVVLSGLGQRGADLVAALEHGRN